MQKIFAILLAGALFIGAPVCAQAASSTSAKGSSGQTLIASISKGVIPVTGTTKVTISGKGFNTKFGIYVTFCVIPEPGKKPELCGPFDVTGNNNQSIWISNDPLFYGKLLVKKFGKGGTFKVTMPIDSTIDEFDCTKVKCAIVTRADHTNPDYRKADVIIPVTFKFSNDPVALAQGGKALTGPVALPVPAAFTSGETVVDCVKVACGIAVRRDHLGGATDFSFDRFIPVTFAATAAVVVKSGVATSDNYIFSAPAPKTEWFIASAYVGAKKIVSKRFY